MHDNGRKCKGYAHVNQCDNTWTGAFVSVYCMSGNESTLEDCTPNGEDTCNCGNHARLLCEPGIIIITLRDP